MELLIGKKIGMTQLFAESGRLTPVTVLEVGPCSIVQVKTPDNDGYGAVQIGFGDIREKLVTNPLKGHFKKAGVAPTRVLKEVRVDDPTQFNVGDALDVNVFEGADKVDVAGTTKGRGFSGTIRRHGFSQGDNTHGGHSIREPGSVGMCATPSRIFKGKRMSGRMGGVRRTVRNLPVVQVDAENNLLYVKGAVPGANNGIVFIRKA